MAELIYFLFVAGLICAVLGVVKIARNLFFNFKAKFLNKIIDGNKRKNGKEGNHH